MSENAKRQGFGQIKLGTHLSEETKRKIGAANAVSNRGKKQSQETIKKRVEANRLKMEETRKKISRATTGRKLSEETRKKISDFRMGKKIPKISGPRNYAWKGDKAGYSSIHCWLRTHFGKADHCDMCGGTRGSKNFGWSCRDHSYTRDLQKWWQLCAKCHKNYDNLFLKKK